MAKRKRYSELRDLDTMGVSLVRRGANKKRFALMKSETEGDDMDQHLEEVLEAVLKMDLEDDEAIDAALEKAQLSEKGMAALKGALRLLSGFKDELPANVMAMLGKLAGYEMPKEEKTEKPEEGEKPEEEKVAKKEETKTEETPEVPAEIEALWKKDQAERDELRKQLEDERNARLEKEYLEKVESKYAHVPGDTAEKAAMLKSAYDRGDEEGKKLEEHFEKTEKSMAHAEMLKEAGTVGQNADGDAWQKIEKAADSVVQKSGTPITKAQAISDFLRTDQGKALYQQYLNEHPAQLRGR